MCVTYMAEMTIVPFRLMKPIFYEGKRGVSLDFKGEKLSSNGGILLIHKGERLMRYIKAFSAKLVDRRVVRLK